VSLLDRELNEFQECFNEFQASFRRKESVRFRNGLKKSCSYNQQNMERELRRKMKLEDSVGLGAARMLAVSKSETQIIESSKTLMLSCARLEGLKNELSLVTKGNFVRVKRSRMAEVSLTDLRIPLAWRQSQENLSDRRKFAIFCSVTSGAQIFDTGVKIVDRNCADITFSEAFLFSNMKPEFDIKLDVFCHKLRGENRGSGPRNWFQKMMGNNPKFLNQRKAMNFKLLTTKHLTVDDCSDEVESHDLDTTRNVSSSSSSSSSFTTSKGSLGRSLQLFGQLCCRLAVTPYSRTEAVRTGRLTLTSISSGGRDQEEDCLDWRLEAEDTLAEDCFVRLSNWRLEMWQSTAQYRRGEEPWRTARLGTSTLVRQHTERICVENEGGESVDLLASSLEDADIWVEDIMEHMEDSIKWGKAASSSQTVEAISEEEEEVKTAGMKRLRQKTASKLMLFYNRISSGDLMERNLHRNDRIVRNRM